MSATVMARPTEVLEERLTRGAELLFDMEQRGDTGPEYGRWLRGWLDLLEQYEGQYGLFIG
ncbi:MAG: hypothetical protein JOZ41_22525 [Chloroflexi bacterium]|nr:hypothetical protein [Chloroflexota bacterium]